MDKFDIYANICHLKMKTELLTPISLQNDIYSLVLHSLWIVGKPPAPRNINNNEVNCGSIDLYLAKCSLNMVGRYFPPAPWAQTREHQADICQPSPLREISKNIRGHKAYKTPN